MVWKISPQIVNNQFILRGVNSRFLLLHREKIYVYDYQSESKLSRFVHRRKHPRIVNNQKETKNWSREIPLQLLFFIKVNSRFLLLHCEKYVYDYQRKSKLRVSRFVHRRKHPQIVNNQCILRRVNSKFLLLHREKILKYDYQSESKLRISRFVHRKHSWIVNNQKGTN